MSSEVNTRDGRCFQDRQDPPGIGAAQNMGMQGRFAGFMACRRNRRPPSPGSRAGIVIALDCRQTRSRARRAMRHSVSASSLRGIWREDRVVAAAGRAGRPVVPSTEASALLAVAEINARGGIRGHPVDLVLGDAGGTVAEAAEAADDLIVLDEVDLLVGMHPSDMREAVTAAVRAAAPISTPRNMRAAGSRPASRRPASPRPNCCGRACTGCRRSAALGAFHRRQRLCLAAGVERRRPGADPRRRRHVGRPELPALRRAGTTTRSSRRSGGPGRMW